jgi:hypothetical protein
VASHASPRDGCAFARADGFAPPAPISRSPSFGGHPRGEIPGQFRGAWLRRSPPRPSTLLAPRPSRSFRPGCVVTRKCECATLLTLTPTFPSRLDPCGPAWSSRTSSPGVVQRSPLHRSEPGSPSPGPHVAVLPFGEGQPVLLAFRPRGFAPPRRFAPPRPCRFVSPCSRSWGSPCFSSSRNEVPHSAAPALRSLPSADSGEAGTCPSPRARVTGPTATVSSDPVSRATSAITGSPVALFSFAGSGSINPFTARLALSPFLSERLSGRLSALLFRAVSRRLPITWPSRSPAKAVRAVSRAGVRSRGPRALLHRRVRCVRRRFQPRTPGAPLGLSPLADASRLPLSAIASPAFRRRERSTPAFRRQKSPIARPAPRPLIPSRGPGSPPRGKPRRPPRGER